jgi:hypothetical protein
VNPRPLPVGPLLKTPGWRGGCFLVGWALLIIFFTWLISVWVSFYGLGRFELILVIVGILLSVPYGTAWLRGRAPRPPREQEPIEVHSTDGRGTTVVVNAYRPRTTTPFAGTGYLAYSLLWRGPVMVGDYALTGFWRTIAWLTSRFGTPEISRVPEPEDLEARDATREIPPDQRRI